MASTFSGIETLISALRAQAMAQRVISHNIANANTKGFSRQNPILTSLAPLNYLGFNTAFGVQQVGSGTTLTSISRIRDEFLDMQIRLELSTRGQQQAIFDALQFIQAIFPELNAVPGTGIVVAVDRLFDDFTGVSTGAVTRGTLVTNAQNMATLFNDASLNLTNLQMNLDGQVKDSIARINNLLEQIASANETIIGAQAVGGVANDVMDKRALALAELGELIKIDTVKLADGSVLVMTGNARTLVRGGTASQLVPVINAHEPKFTNVGLRDPMNGVITDITGEITGGAINGQLIARDELVADKLLQIDELAHSLITQVNLLHQAGYDGLTGTTTNVAFFVGTEARDIAVNDAVVANLDLVAASRLNGVPGNLEQAESIGLLNQKVMNAIVQSAVPVNSGAGLLIDPTVPLNSGAGTPLNIGGSNSVNWLAGPLAASGSIIINGVTMAWDATVDSMEDLVDRINNLGVGARASFDYTQQRMTLFSDGPLTVSDAVGNLAAVLRLETRVTSLAPINNGIGPADRPINLASPLSASVLEYRTLSSPSGIIIINGVSVNWNEGQDLATILANINAAIVPIGLVASFNPADQRVSITGTVAVAGASPITIVDTAGNLSQVLNLDAQPTFTAFSGDPVLGTGMLAQMQAQLDNAQALKDQADAAVAQLELQRDAISKVDINEEKARLLDYLRAYEAAIRAMSILDEALNVLINKMAVTTGSGGVSGTGVSA